MECMSPSWLERVRHHCRNHKNRHKSSLEYRHETMGFQPHSKSTDPGHEGTIQSQGLCRNHQATMYCSEWNHGSECYWSGLLPLFFSEKCFFLRGRAAWPFICTLNGGHTDVCKGRRNSQVNEKRFSQYLARSLISWIEYYDNMRS